MQPLGPTRAEERIASIDVLRGFALLGILLMNIVGFGLWGAYDDPTVSGGSTGINLWTWIVLHVLAEGKMRCLFSMVFGAGVILLTARSEKSGTSAADIFYRRNLWLLGAGVLHAYLLWLGEILYPYALCALALYPFRVLNAKRLLTLASLLMVLNAGCYIFRSYDTNKLIVDGLAAQKLSQSGAKLTEEQIAAQKKWEGLRDEMKPSPAEVEKKNKQWQGSFLDVLKVRASVVQHWHYIPYYSPLNLDIFSMMFLGMGLFKLGVFSGERSRGFYARMAAIGYLIGIATNSFSAYIIVRDQFDIRTMLSTSYTYDLGRVSVALGHAGLLLLMFQSNWFAPLLRSLAAVGQMALSNYLTHSVVCTLIFCGFGFGLFGRLERYQLYYVVAGLWIFQLIVSPIWLRHFRFGPAEWAWRSLTYWQKQPMRKQELKAAEMTA